MALDVQISFISATLMTDVETRKSIYFLRPSLCYFRRSVEMCVGEGKRIVDGRLGSIDQATNLGKPIPETCAIFAQGEGREPPSPSSSVRAPVQLTVHHDVIFLTNTSRGHYCFPSSVAWSHLTIAAADSLLSFGKLADELHVHQNRRCFITLLVVPPL